MRLLAWQDGKSKAELRLSNFTSAASSQPIYRLVSSCLSPNQSSNHMASSHSIFKLHGILKGVKVAVFMACLRVHPIRSLVNVPCHQT